MSETEGVIKFQLDFKTAVSLPQAELSELSAWRDVMVQLQMIGQTPERYAGYGFGNISRRYPLDGCPNAFLISGTQTGGAATLTPEQFATVLNCYPEENRVLAEGPMRPSSESMTHGVIYALAPEVNWIMHAHSPHIWQAVSRLGIPETKEAVSYGSPEMSAEVVRLFAETAVSQNRIFSMAGHEDGIVTFGKTAEEAGHVLLDMLAASLR
jgi:ribulose-5-phosphate 4-epimerase/fuculose-1-phosphate aldolase